MAYGISAMKGGGIAIDGPEGMEVFRLIALESRLKMEASGLRFRGSSGRTLAKAWYGFTGNRESVLKQVQAYRAEHFPIPHEHTWGPFEQTRLTGATIQRCTGDDCNVVNAYADDVEGPE